MLDARATHTLTVTSPLRHLHAVITALALIVALWSPLRVLFAQTVASGVAQREAFDLDGDGDQVADDPGDRLAAPRFTGVPSAALAVVHPDPTAYPPVSRERAPEQHFRTPEPPPPRASS